MSLSRILIILCLVVPLFVSIVYSDFPLSGYSPVGGLCNDTFTNATTITSVKICDICYDCSANDSVCPLDFVDPDLFRCAYFDYDCGDCVDADLDGAFAYPPISHPHCGPPWDCNDNNPAIMNPTVCDWDCDGFENQGMSLMPPYTTNCAAAPYWGTDCDDNDSTTHPGAMELCDNKDNDCDENYYLNGDPRTIDIVNASAFEIIDINLSNDGEPDDDFDGIVDDDNTSTLDDVWIPPNAFHPLGEGVDEDCDFDYFAGSFFGDGFCINYTNYSSISGLDYSSLNCNWTLDYIRQAKPNYLDCDPWNIFVNPNYEEYVVNLSMPGDLCNNSLDDDCDGYCDWNGCPGFPLPDPGCIECENNDGDPLNYSFPWNPSCGQNDCDDNNPNVWEHCICQGGQYHSPEISHCKWAFEHIYYPITCSGVCGDNNSDTCYCPECDGIAAGYQNSTTYVSYGPPGYICEYHDEPYLGNPLQHGYATGYYVAQLCNLTNSSGLADIGFPGDVDHDCKLTLKDNNANEMTSYFNRWQYSLDSQGIGSSYIASYYLNIMPYGPLFRYQRNYVNITISDPDSVYDVTTASAMCARQIWLMYDGNYASNWKNTIIPCKYAFD